MTAPTTNCHAGARRGRPGTHLTRLPALVCLVTLALIAGCSPVGFAELLFTGNHYQKAEGIAYGQEERQRLDVYRAEGLDGPRPVVVFIYGGRWQEGSREIYDLLGDRFTRHGITTVVPDYTLYPDTLFPGWVEEAARAVAWTVGNIAEFGGNPEWIYLVGHSAGAHTVTLLEMDERYLRAANVPAGSIRGVVSISGPVATEWTDADVQALMGPREGWPVTYPRNFVDASVGPILFLHGEGDSVLSPRNSVELAASIRTAGGCARAIVYPGIGHVEIMVKSMIPWLGRIDPVEDIVEFVSSPTSCQQADRIVTDPAGGEE